MLSFSAVRTLPEGSAFLERLLGISDLPAKLAKVPVLSHTMNEVLASPEGPEDGCLRSTHQAVFSEVFLWGEEGGTLKKTNLGKMNCSLLLQ